jgi:hypothetical protein
MGSILVSVALVSHVSVLGSSLQSHTPAVRITVSLFPIVFAETWFTEVALAGIERSEDS